MKKKYELIIEYILNLAETNKLKQGDKIPSIRNVAKKFHCNKSTVIRAYKELEFNHKVFVIPRGGYYLVDKKNLIDNNCNIIDFSTVTPDAKLLPYQEFNHCVNRAVDVYKQKLFTYGDTRGLESFRKTLVNHFRDYHIYTKEDRVFITTGAQQALSILMKMSFLNEKNNILVEQPTYRLIHSLQELNGNKLIGIKRDNLGIDFNELEMKFKNDDIKFFYTIPRFHNPLGLSYKEEDKKKIVELAKKYNVYIVEDDYLADLDTNKKSLPTFYYDLDNRVIYVKSFSKTFMPGIRIGAVILPEELRDEFIKHKKCDDLNTSVLAQGALEIFINSGMYKNHIKKIQLEYKKKMNCIRECLKTHEKMNFILPLNGFFVWIKLVKEISVNTLIKRLKLKNVIIAKTEEFFINKDLSVNSFTICISKLSLDEIRYGLNLIVEEINNL